MNPRLLVLTDISSLTPAVREPDDGQSMVRLMLYSNEIDIEGLVASSNMGHGQICRPELIHQVVDAYAQVRDSLLRHSPGYPLPEQLQRGIHAGQPIAGPTISLTDCIGAQKDSAASEWIIQTISRSDPRPLWISIWGGTTDLAQALWRLRETTPEDDLNNLLANLRVHAVGDQDSTGKWIKEQFPGVFYITRGYGIRGMYRGGDQSLVSAQWVDEHITRAHGPLGAIYPNYNGGDIWASKLGPVKGIKEGDTPSYLSMVANGLNPDMVPEWGSWGGRMTPRPNQPGQFIDAVDLSQPDTLKDPQPEMSATHRWRPAFQNDFAARMDWCVQPYENANHAPQIRLESQPAGQINHGAWLVFAACGDWITLDASQSSDPDGQAITYHWWIYPEAGSYRGDIQLEGENSPVLHMRTIQVAHPETVHLILTVQDSGNPPLVSYQRVVLAIYPL